MWRVYSVSSPLDGAADPSEGLCTAHAEHEGAVLIQQKPLTCLSWAPALRGGMYSSWQLLLDSTALVSHSSTTEAVQ